MSKALDNAIKAIEDKIEEQIPEFEKAQPAQTVTTPQGDTKQMANPAFDAFINMSKAYASLLKSRKEIDGNAEAETKTLDNLRNKFKIVV